MLAYILRETRVVLKHRQLLISWHLQCGLLTFSFTNMIMIIYESCIKRLPFQQGHILFYGIGSYMSTFPSRNSLSSKDMQRTYVKQKYKQHYVWQEKIYFDRYYLQFIITKAGYDVIIVVYSCFACRVGEHDRI
jgi:hypothetical protein